MLKMFSVAWLPGIFAGLDWREGSLFPYRPHPVFSREVGQRIVEAVNAKYGNVAGYEAEMDAFLFVRPGECDVDIYQAKKDEQGNAWYAIGGDWSWGEAGTH